MKKNEIIELNGVEYTLELNRDSFLQIDKLCNVQKSFQILEAPMYNYVEGEIDDNFDPSTLITDDEELDKEVELKNKTLEKLIERSLLIWLYPNHKLNISQVRELIKPYLEDDEKSKELGAKIGQYLRECITIRENYIEERKNLKAQTNKK